MLDPGFADEAVLVGHLSRRIIGEIARSSFVTMASHRQCPSLDEETIHVCDTLSVERNIFLVVCFLEECRSASGGTKAVPTRAVAMDGCSILRMYDDTYFITRDDS